MNQTQFNRSISSEAEEKTRVSRLLIYPSSCSTTFLNSSTSNFGKMRLFVNYRTAVFFERQVFDNRIRQMWSIALLFGGVRPRLSYFGYLT
jgi:hypothetical protein